jgi:hypothetical protein
MSKSDILSLRSGNDSETIYLSRRQPPDPDILSIPVSGLLRIACSVMY